jgi:hypothetical protein
MAVSPPGAQQSAPYTTSATHPNYTALFEHDRQPLENGVTEELSSRTLPTQIPIVMQTSEASSASQVGVSDSSASFAV